MFAIPIEVTNQNIYTWFYIAQTNISLLILFLIYE